MQLNQLTFQQSGLLLSSPSSLSYPCHFSFLFYPSYPKLEAQWSQIGHFVEILIGILLKTNYDVENTFFKNMINT